MYMEGTKFSRRTFTAKFYSGPRLIEHYYQQNAINKSKLREWKLGGSLTHVVEF